MRVLLWVLVALGAVPSTAAALGVDGVVVRQGLAVDARVQDAAVDTVEAGAPFGREALEALEFPPLAFDPPRAVEHEVAGVTVFHLRDPALPLVDVQLLLRGGITHFPRERFGTLSALPFAIRNGGTRTLPPDSVDRRIDLLALQLSVSRGGGGTSISLNALDRHVDAGLALLGEILLEPRFDLDAIEVWRGQELERVRRREDNAGALAFSEFNRLMYGEHPVGWVLSEADLEPGRLSEDALRRAHEELFCRDRMIVGVSGDLTWEEAEARLQDFLDPWPECESELTDPPLPELRETRGVFVLPKDLDQSTVILAGPSDVRQEDSPAYFASRAANYLLGGRGFSSRILSRLRTQEGLTYGASSVWTTPRRAEGLVGAFSSTRSDRTIEATRVLLEVLETFRAEPPHQGEVSEAAEEIARGYVFAFESAAQIVARRMSFRAQGLPDAWLERYLEGLQEVTAESVRETVREHLRPDRMTILIVGDPGRFDTGLAALGPVFELSPNGTTRPQSAIPESGPDGSPPPPR